MLPSGGAHILWSRAMSEMAVRRLLYSSSRKPGWPSAKSPPYPRMLQLLISWMDAGIFTSGSGSSTAYLALTVLCPVETLMALKADRLMDTQKSKHVSQFAASCVLMSDTRHGDSRGW